METGKSFQITCRVSYKNTDYSRYDHKYKQITVQVIAGLEQRPYGNNTGYHDIKENDDVPYSPA